MSVLVCIASRDRPQALKRAIDSVLDTSTRADVAVYVDDDQWDDYKEILARDRVKFIAGERKGPVYSLNYLCEMFPGYEAYGAATDDCEFISRGWDSWVIAEVGRMPNGVGCLSPYHGVTRRMDFPWVSARWLEIVGYLANPGCHSVYWDVGLEVLAEQIHITRATDLDFLITHDQMVTPGVHEHFYKDARAVVLWLTFERPVLLKKLKEAACS